MPAFVMVVPTPAIVLPLILIFLALWMLFWAKVVMPQMAKYVDPWIWRRVGGTGDPPDHPDSD